MAKNTLTELAPTGEVRASGRAFFIYLGPSLVSPVPLTHRAVFSGGLPDFAQGLLKTDADLAACFVPLQNAGRALRELEGMLPAGDLTRHYTTLKKRYARTV